jgi:aspartate-semialdehyde dehydrogenase
VADNSSAFRMEPQVPFVVPEINPQTLRAHRASSPIPTAAIISITPQGRALGSGRPLD